MMLMKRKGVIENASDRWPFEQVTRHTVRGPRYVIADLKSRISKGAQGEILRKTAEIDFHSQAVHKAAITAPSVTLIKISALGPLKRRSDCNHSVKTRTSVRTAQQPPRKCARIFSGVEAE